MNSTMRRWCALVALGASTLSGAALAQSAAFREFEGAWTGTGSLSRRDGAAERIRCSADYAVRADLLNLRLQCISDSTSFELRSTLQNQAGQLSGEWVEPTRNARGNIAGVLSRGVMRGTAQGPGFAASIAISVRGNRQNVAIRAEGADITGVNVALTRRR